MNPPNQLQDVDMIPGGHCKEYLQCRDQNVVVFGCIPLSPIVNWISHIVSEHI